MLNCCSIRDSLKTDFLVNTIQIFDPVIITLLETFLIAEDKFYIRNYRIFRADNDTRRKGVAIFMNKFVKVNVKKLLFDVNGRFLNFRLLNEESGEEIYAEQSFEKENGIIPDVQIYVIGDMNSYNSG